MNSHKLKLFLENQYSLYHSPEYLRLDPLICLKGFVSGNDLEIAGIMASVLAYGRAEIIIRNVSEIFKRTGRCIARFSIDTSLDHKYRLFKDFRHRFNDGHDVALLLQSVGILANEYGSLESLFIEGGQGQGAIKNALVHFTEKIKQQAARLDPARRKGIEYLLPSPRSGSACKRLNMYLRWMVRPADGIDLGVWRNISPSMLVIPVDTHVARIARGIGLTKRATVNWLMAEEITEKLKTCDAADPVRYDFSLCRSGMVEFRRKAA
ncbi:MAG: TIGR02757 family protein [Chitinispirillaceae bacterium]|jgi:uncharacterized protein (TIGR02757 family)